MSELKIHALTKSLVTTIAAASDSSYSFNQLVGDFPNYDDDRHCWSFHCPIFESYSSMRYTRGIKEEMADVKTEEILSKFRSIRVDGALEEEYLRSLATVLSCLADSPWLEANCDNDLKGWTDLESVILGNCLAQLWDFDSSKDYAEGNFEYHPRGTIIKPGYIRFLWLHFATDDGINWNIGRWRVMIQITDVLGTAGYSVNVHVEVEKIIDKVLSNQVDTSTEQEYNRENSLGKGNLQDEVR